MGWKWGEGHPFRIKRKKPLGGDDGSGTDVTLNLRLHTLPLIVSDQMGGKKKKKRQVNLKSPLLAGSCCCSLGISDAHIQSTTTHPTTSAKYQLQVC